MRSMVVLKKVNSGYVKYPLLKIRTVERKAIQEADRIVATP